MGASFLDANSIIRHFSSQLKKPVENYAGYMSAKALDEFAVQLVEYRIAHQMNQKELAHLLGISQPMISQYEAGINNITVKRLCEICEKIGTRVQISYEDASAPVSGRTSDGPYLCDPDPATSESFAA